MEQKWNIHGTKMGLRQVPNSGCKILPLATLIRKNLLKAPLQEEVQQSLKAEGSHSRNA